MIGVAREWSCGEMLVSRHAESIDRDQSVPTQQGHARYTGTGNVVSTWPRMRLKRVAVQDKARCAHTTGGRVNVRKEQRTYIKRVTMKGD